MTLSNRSTLRAYLIAQTLLGGFFLALSLLKPSQARRALVLGMSWQRLVVSLFLLLAFLGSVAVLISVLRRPAIAARLSRGLRGKLHAVALDIALLAILSGAVALVTDAMGLAPAIAPHLDHLRPISWWLLVSGLVLAATVLAHTEVHRERDASGFVLIFLICLLGIFVNSHLWPKTETTDGDVYYAYLEGKRLVQGENPYARVLAGDMRTDSKYATYLPLFYYLSAGTRSMGLIGFLPWIAFWRMVFLLANLWIAKCIFSAAWSAGGRFLAVFGSLFWLFNRWTLHVTVSGDLDFLPLALVIVSYALLARRPRMALFIFGLSIAIKHYSIFLAPVLLLHIWLTSGNPKARAIKDIVSLGSVPLIVSIPFLYSNAVAFVVSILFEGTRNPGRQLPSLDALLGWSGLQARLPMLALILLIYVAAWRYRVGPFASALLIMATVTFFNSVFFTSYMIWVVPFIPLACVEAMSHLRAASMRPADT